MGSVPGTRFVMGRELELTRAQDTSTWRESEKLERRSLQRRPILEREIKSLSLSLASWPEGGMYQFAELHIECLLSSLLLS